MPRLTWSHAANGKQLGGDEILLGATVRLDQNARHVCGNSVWAALKKAGSGA